MIGPGPRFIEGGPPPVGEQQAKASASEVPTKPIKLKAPEEKQTTDVLSELNLQQKQKLAGTVYKGVRVPNLTPEETEQLLNIELDRIKQYHEDRDLGRK